MPPFLRFKGAYNPMGPFLIRRSLLVLPVLFGVAIVVFVALHLAPGNPAQLLLGPMATPAQLHQLTVQLGLDKPLIVQFWDWLSGVVRGDLGWSIQYHQSVSSLVLVKLVNTLILAVTAFVLSSVIGILIGLISGYWSGKWIDHVLNVANFIALSLPVFWLGQLFILVLGLHYHWFPISGMYQTGDTETLGQLMHHLVLPSVALAAAPGAVIAQITRVSFIEELRQQYMLTARSKGITYIKAAVKHALRNAWIPIVTTLGLEINYLIGGDVLIENVYSWPGVGQLLVQSVLSRDYPTILGATILLAVIFVLINFAVDALYPILNPKVDVHE